MQQVLNDHAYMSEALRQACKGLYTTRTNPRVGCVLVKQNKIIGVGHHQYPGQNHAEVNALNNATENVENATAYVTLEPCSHHGNTPPCAEALTSAKLNRVVIAMVDPNPLVNGKGLSYFKQHGITTEVNVLEKEALELNKGFVKRISTGYPYVTVKSAISMDGRTALDSGESKWITSEHARLDVQKLRARSCAVLTGIDTVLTDDPSLAVRLSKKDLNIEGDFEQPVRVIVDTQLRISPSAKLLSLPGDVIIYTGSDNAEKLSALTDQNVDCVKTTINSNRVDLNAVMLDLSKRGINEVLVEAGSTLVGSLLEQSLVDELIMYIAPHLLGDMSRGLAQLPSVVSMQERIELEVIETNIIGKEIKVKTKPIVKTLG